MLQTGAGRHALTTLHCLLIVSSDVQGAGHQAPSGSLAGSSLHQPDAVGEPTGQHGVPAMLVVAASGEEYPGDALAQAEALERDLVTGAALCCQEISSLTITKHVPAIRLAKDCA